MLLQNLHIAGGHEIYRVKITGNTIAGISQDENLRGDPGEPVLVFENAVAIPGLINSHDHLDFNLFPPMASRIYRNYIAWGTDIQDRYRKEIEAVSKVPAALRVQWGLCKNILAGVTTVVNHGKRLSVKSPLIDVFQTCHSLHSVSRESYWRIKLNNPFAKSWPYVIHTGEGTDDTANREIDQLIRWNLLKKELVGVHGVAMKAAQAEQFKALVWCPASNFFLLGQTAAVDALKTKTNILFGTDSTLTGDWNIWEQLRLAKNTGLLSAREIFDALTVTPASVWVLQDRGLIAAGKKADLVVIRSKGETRSFEALYQTNPEDILLVIKSGKPVLYDESLSVQLKEHIPGFSSFMINSSRKYIRYDLPGLMREILQFLPSFEFPLAAI